MGLLHWNTPLHPRQRSPLYPAADYDVDNAAADDVAAGVVGVAVVVVVVSSEA